MRGYVFAFGFAQTNPHNPIMSEKVKHYKYNDDDDV